MASLWGILEAYHIFIYCFKNLKTKKLREKTKRYLICYASFLFVGFYGFEITS